MKNLTLKTLAIFSFAAALSLPARATLATTETANAPTQADNADILAGDATDLILQGSSSESSYSYVSSIDSGEIVNGADLNDGLADLGSGISNDEYTANGYVTYTFNLNTNTNPLLGAVGSADGYTINEFDLYSGYNGGFYQQFGFTIAVETTTSDGTFLPIGTSFSNYLRASSDGNQVNRTQITDSTGTIATNVIALQLVDYGIINKEFQVLGSPTVAQVPEPATWALMLGGLGFLGLWLRRRSA